MNEYISVQDAVEHLTKVFCALYGAFYPRVVIDEVVKKALSEVPTIEAVPVRKGHWFFSSTDFLTHCSACGTGKWKGYCPTPEEATEWMPICPHCGADMRGEDDEL